MPINNNILIVEDEHLAFEYLKTILNKLEYKNIYHAQSCEEAQNILATTYIDFTFMDINIKGSTDGINCAKKFDIPTIYTTVYKDFTTLNDAKNTNIYGYITKPFDINEVFIAISILEKFINQNGSSNIQIATKMDKNSDIFDFGEGRFFDFKKLVLVANGLPIKLSNQETILLEFFCKNHEQYLSYDVLKTHVWNNIEISNSTIRDAIYRLKLKFPGEFPIKNSSTLGYFLSP